MQRKSLFTRLFRTVRRSKWDRMPSRALPLSTYRIPSEEEANELFHACMRVMVVTRAQTGGPRA